MVDWERRHRTLQDALADADLVVGRVDLRVLRDRLRHHGWKGKVLPGEGEMWFKIDCDGLRMPAWIDTTTREQIHTILRMLANEEHSHPAVVLESLIHASEGP